MKQLTCEMCGGTDLIKQDGVFVCQSCGMKYSVEEAKKMVIEGTVDVTGSAVKIDSSEDIDNLFILARRAKAAGDYASATKYYQMITVKDPKNWEAYFFSMCFKLDECSVQDFYREINIMVKCIGETFHLIADNVNDPEVRRKAVEEVIATSCALGQMIEIRSKSVYNNLSLEARIEEFNINWNLENSIACMRINESLLDSICIFFAEDEAVMRGIGIAFLKERIADDIFEDDELNRYAAIIRKYEPDYQIPECPETDMSTAEKSTASSGGCYVATAVYGSYDCPQVWTLRRYRDYTLAETWYGRAFIHTYYAISPTLVKWFGDTEWFKRMWKGKLDRMVANMKAEGVKDTPYEDRNW